MDIKNERLLKLSRTFKEGFHNFRRNGLLSVATVSVLGVSLYVMSATILIGVVANSVLGNIRDNIEISVYFNPTVPEERILEIKGKLEGYREIKSVGYVSKEQALDEFKKLSADDSAITQALEEVGENPLLSSLSVKAHDPAQYELISSSLRDSSYASDISRINYDRNKERIERLSTIVGLIEQVGLTLGIVFVVIGVLITFNAIRLTMYAHKGEFEVMRLVGASNLYIRMPFVFEGIFYGTVSAVVVFLMLLGTARFAAPLTQGALAEGNMFDFYLNNFFLILGALLFSGILLGVVSSFIAIKRYLKV
ncbi:MAG TPA: permease-like cell division protein FtsX [Candidatus Moranbacteria bacterium]|nr:permease-like cell division protein FtsX [Candidatus Moranbacteria bacterium]